MSHLDLLDRCARLLREACVRETGLITVHAGPEDSVPLRHPPLFTTLELGDIRLDALLSVCYPIDISQAEAVQTWSSACETFSRGWLPATEVPSVFQQALPAVPFSGMLNTRSITSFAQFLAAVSRQHGQLTTKRREVELRLGAHRLRVEAHALEWPGRRYRFRPLRPELPGLLAAAPIAKQAQAHPKLGALLWHLCRALPDLAEQARLLCMVASHLGRQAVAVVVNNFDVVFDADGGDRQGSLASLMQLEQQIGIAP